MLTPQPLADAWIAAAALEPEAVLIHQDPEFRAVGEAREELPVKTKRGRRI